MTVVFALLGAKALYFLFLWLISAIGASWLSERKGYGEKPGLATGLLLSVLGLIIWVFVPARTESKWKRLGPFKRDEGAVAAAPEQEPRASG
jgi:hypothetical protein